MEKDVGKFIGYLKVGKGVTWIDENYLRAHFVSTDVPLPEYTNRYVMCRRQASIDMLEFRRSNNFSWQDVVSLNLIRIANQILRDQFMNTGEHTELGAFVIAYATVTSGWDVMVYGDAMAALKLDVEFEESEVNIWSSIDTQALRKAKEEGFSELPKITGEWAKQLVYDAFYSAMEDIMIANPLIFGWWVEDWATVKVAFTKFSEYYDVHYGDENDGKWHHQSFEVDHGDMKVYVDGAQLQSARWAVGDKSLVMQMLDDDSKKVRPASTVQLPSVERVVPCAVIDPFNKEIHAIGYGPKSNTIVVFNHSAGKQGA